MKLSAWEDRRAPRDLFDLAGLTTLDAFTSETLDMFITSTGWPPEPGRVPPRVRRDGRGLEETARASDT